VTRLLVEVCAGTAALSWSLVGAKFPVSRMGSKSGYSDAIKGALGLHTAPDAFLWVEPDLELARTLALLTTPGGPQAVAEVIRSWVPCPNGHVEGEDTRSEGAVESLPITYPTLADTFCPECSTREDPISTGKQDARRLWDRLRKERPETSPEREAGWLYAISVSYNAGDDGGGLRGFVHPETGGRYGASRADVARKTDALPVARHLVLSASNRLIHATTHADGSWRNTGKGGTTHGGTEFSDSAADVAARLWVLGNSWRGDGDHWKKVPENAWGDTDANLTRRGAAAALHRLPTMPTTSVLCCGAEEIDPAAVLEAYGVEGADVVCYADPPYLNTTGYLHEFDREAVVRVCAAWHRVGATVAISEAEGLDVLMAEATGADWFTEDITSARRGQRRTFSKQQREVLTLNRPPVSRHAWPSRDALTGQPSLFG